MGKFTGEEVEEEKKVFFERIVGLKVAKRREGEVPSLLR